MIRRIIMLVPILIGMSMVAFFLIQLPPGDYVSMRINQMRMSGVTSQKYGKSNS
jgi:peptide/nickel transport system permease protein